MYLTRGVGAVFKTVPRLRASSSASIARLNVVLRTLSSSITCSNQDADKRAIQRTIQLKPIYKLTDLKYVLYGIQAAQVLMNWPALVFISYKFIWSRYSDEVHEIGGFEFVYSDLYLAFPYFAIVFALIAVAVNRMPLRISYKPASNTYVATMMSALVPFRTWDYEFPPGLGVPIASPLPALTGNCLIDGKKRVYIAKSDFTSTKHYHDIFKSHGGLSGESSSNDQF